jgi:hypothetical protein
MGSLVWTIVLVFHLISSYSSITLPQLNGLDLKEQTFWRSFGPDLHIYDAELSQQQFYFDSSVVNATSVYNLVMAEGYAQLDPLKWNLPLESMLQMIEQLHTRGLPITFCYLYDEFWYLFMRLHLTIEHILGVNYQRLPDFWAWRVDPGKEERGWAVHRDKNFETLFVDGAPKTVSVWIPLTDATTSNGCMYVLPADRDPTYRYT